MLLTHRIKKITSYDVFGYSLIALSFAIPFSLRIISVFIAVVILIWCFTIISNRKEFRWNINWTSLWVVVFYVSCIVSYFISDNLIKAKFDMEVKLSLFLFPIMILLLGNFQWTKTMRNKLLVAFVAGSLIMTLISYGIAIYRCITIFYTYEFFTYGYLANYLHPSYYAMNVCFSIIVVILILLERWREFSVWKKTGFITLIFYFMIFVVLLNSKAGILVMFLSVFIVLVSYILYHRKFLLALIVFATMTVGSILMVRMFPFVSSRFDDMNVSLANIKNLDPKTENDSEQRLLIWKYASNLIKKNWLTGVGSGDVSSSLNQVYHSEGFVAGMRKNLNCHNQFLQSFLANGILGFLALMAALSTLIISGIRQKNLLAIAFFIIIAGTMLTESILEVQAGTVFFGFFISWLTIKNNKIEKSVP